MPFMGVNRLVPARICLPVAWLDMSAAGGGGIFVSYRREESGGVAGRLSDRLIDRFGAKQVFIDVEAIEPGADFAEVISRAVDACVVLVAVIGRGWLLAADERGGRRLDDPDDLVRLEIRAALARGVRVIPVLVEGAVMPRRGDLPENLAGLARRNALLVRHESFRDDVGRLVAAVERVLASAVVAGGTEGAQSAGDDPGAVVRESPEPGRNDLAWAARLFGDAERIANTLTDETDKAYALSTLAAAVAATDPGHAARLIADAERIANTITDENEKAEVLMLMAGAVAVTDPGRAERIANSITEESAKAWALSSVAGALAATDPGHAARLIADAERIASTLTDEDDKAWTLSDIAVAVAVTDPGCAEHIADTITDGFNKVWALSGIAKALAT
jgi:TIR domain